MLTGCGSKGAQQSVDAAPQATETPIDVDLSAMSGTVCYAQVFDMLQSPDNYTGQTVRMTGTLSYYQDPNTLKEYFAVVIADATACCAQGIEFDWAGEHTWPQDYPALDSEVTVTGTFDTYTEDGYLYVQLKDAQLQV